MPKRVFCDALDNSQHQLEIYRTADMSSSNYSTPGADCGAATAAIPVAPSTPEAAVNTCATGLASNTFGIQDTRRITPLSLPPEEE